MFVYINFIDFFIDFGLLDSVHFEIKYGLLLL